jgi:RecJ-like exonuclease
MKRALLLILVIAVAFVGWYSYKEYNRKNVDLTSVDATVQTNVASLVNAFERDSAAATRTYVDKVIAVQGNVKEIDAEGNPVVIFLGDPGSMSSVKCSMDSAHADGYKAVSKGSLVTIKGTCSGYQTEELLGTDVELTRCVIQNK